MARPDLLGEWLSAKDRSDVIAFLGEPDNEYKTDHFTYDLGDMNGPYRWTLWVLFDQEGKVLKIFGDD